MTDLKAQTRQMIDSLKTICANFGLGNDGNEFKIITQVFLYKYLNDKFAYDVKAVNDELAQQGNEWQRHYEQMSDDEQELLYLQLPSSAILKPHHLIHHLSARQNEADFAKLFDDTLFAIATDNTELYAVKTDGGAKVVLFERLSQYISDPSKRDEFCRAIINKISGFSFEHIFNQKYDFYADIFEYLIKDYNSNSGGKYAEYYTPNAVARIMAEILVPKEQRGKLKSQSVYDPSAGSGSLLMSVAHIIGEDKCAVYTQDISQKSSNLLRLNLILNNLPHSIGNVIQGNTLLNPQHKENGELKKFDFIVSNPPFKLDFSDFREQLDSKENKERFFAGVPKIPKKEIDKMPIYQLFIQHIIASLKDTGKAAIVLPTGFITAQSGIDKKIREYLVKNKMLAGVVSMPSNIFATTGTNVSILFLDKSNQENVILIDASNLGEKIKDGKNQKTVLSIAEENKICETFANKKAIEDFSVVVSYDDIANKNHSLSAGQYFDVKIDYVDISESEFNEKMQGFEQTLNDLFEQSKTLEQEIQTSLKTLVFKS